MPTTVTGTDAVAYHLWQLPDLSAPEPSKTIQITTIKNELGDGYRTSLLTGSNTGVRSWKLSFPTLASSTIGVPTATDSNGSVLSREQYVWSVYIENQITGTPFAYQDPDTNQYYLVDFMDEKLTYERMRVKLFSTGLEIRQRRMTGVSIFNPASMFGSQPSSWFLSDTVTDYGGSPVAFTLTGDVLTDSSTAFDVWRLNSITNTGKLKQNGAGTFAIWDLFIVMKVDETVFGQTSGVFTGTTEQFLIGTSGQAYFTALGADITNLEYRYNGNMVTTALTAPMNRWGLVHCRYLAGKSITDPQIGQDRTVGTSTKAEIDVAEVIYFAGTEAVAKCPRHLIRELSEYLLTKYTYLINT